MYAGAVSYICNKEGNGDYHVSCKDTSDALKKLMVSCPDSLQRVGGQLFVGGQDNVDGSRKLYVTVAQVPQADRAPDTHCTQSCDGRDWRERR